MSKNKHLVAVGLGLLIVVLSGGVVWMWQHKHADKPLNRQNQSETTDSQPGSLSVNSSTAQGSVGQLSGTQNQNPAGGVQAQGNNNSSSSSSIDPASFAQYDKYKDDKAALFGEIQAGSGAELTVGKKAAVLYKGWLTNGQVFDQSRAGSDGKLQPFVFTLGAHQVIPGWEQGMAGMKVGGQRLLIIPPAVGYGSQGQGPIPPNSVLVFQVQLIDVQ